MTAAACCLAGMAADSSADRGQGVWPASVTVGIFKSPLCDGGNVPPCLRVNGTRLHAWKVRFQPVEVNEFGGLLNQLAAPFNIPWPTLSVRRGTSAVTYLETVMFTVVDSPDTVTDWVDGLPSSLHVFSV